MRTRRRKWMKGGWENEKEVGREEGKTGYRERRDGKREV